MNRRLLLHTAALAVCLNAVAGCREPVAPSPPGHLEIAVETDKPQYSLATDSVARVKLTNRGDGAVFLPMDSYVVYERFRDGAWRDAFTWFVVDGVGRSFPLSPGASLTDDLQLRFYLPNRPGTYRFRYFVYADPEVTSLLPVKERVSPPFTLSP
jgi:hypothetical protein